MLSEVIHITARSSGKTAIIPASSSLLIQSVKEFGNVLTDFFGLFLGHIVPGIGQRLKLRIFNPCFHKVDKKAIANPADTE